MILHGWPESLTVLEKYTCIGETVTTVQSFPHSMAAITGRGFQIE